MADPICRWRNPYLKTIREFINVLPKEEMKSAEAREIIEKKFEGFFHTPYQLACQLGLYFENDSNYIPRFTYEPTLNEVYDYIRNWIKKYYVPNPYTKQGFNELKPTNIHSKLCELLYDSKRNINWDNAKQVLFQEQIGNDDILTNTINNYSDVIQIKSNQLQLKDGVIYNDLDKFIEGHIEFERNDKKSFFYHFGSPLIVSDKKQITVESFDINAFLRLTKLVNFKIEGELVTRFASSLLTKPFVILTGLSGSGKTKLAQAFTQWICEDEKQYCIVPVGADWTNREPLLGFPNALKSGEYVKPDNKVLDLIIAANADPDKPYFLILDEMNLSHVERYFADFLSVMESNGTISLHPILEKENWNDVPAELSLPKNLFIIGTVNIDETTYMFSPKVLDRANVIEFRVTYNEMKDYFNSAKGLDLKNLVSQGIGMASSFIQIAKDKSIQPVENDVLQKALLSFFTELKKTGAEFGYRSASEIIRFAAVANVIEPDWTITEIIDVAIMQKLLPKVHGSRRKLEPVLRTLGSLCLKDKTKIEEYISPKEEINFSDVEKVLYPISLEKVLRMNQGLIDNGFTSYAEA